MTSPVGRPAGGAGPGGALTAAVTLGVAVAVPEPWASELRTHRASFGDAQAGVVPTHVTLLPPTVVAPSRLSEVRDHLGLVARRHPVFPMRLRGTGTFRPVSPVVFVTVAEGISASELLAESVRAGPLAIEAAFPYHPHVTVAHHVAESELDRAFDSLADFACAFDVDAFRLYVHDHREGWRTDTVFSLRED